MWRGTLARKQVKKTRAGLLILKTYREYKTRVYVNTLLHLFRWAYFDVSLQILNRILCSFLFILLVTYPISLFLGLNLFLLVNLSHNPSFQDPSLIFFYNIVLSLFFENCNNSSLMKILEGYQVQSPPVVKKLCQLKY